MSKSAIDPYQIPSSIDDSILLKGSYGLITPTSYPAPVLKPHDRDDHATSISPFASPRPFRFERADVPLGSSASSHLAPINTDMDTGMCYQYDSSGSSPPSPASSEFTLSAPYLYSSSSSPLHLPPSPMPTPTRITHLHPKLKPNSIQRTLVPENFKLSDGNTQFKFKVILAPTPTPPPPTYSPHAGVVGQRSGRKDVGLGDRNGRQ